MRGSRKYPYPPRGWSLEILRRGEISQKFKGKYEAKLEISCGGRAQTKTDTTPGGVMNIFWNHTLYIIYYLLHRKY